MEFVSCHISGECLLSCVGVFNIVSLFFTNKPYMKTKGYCQDSYDLQIFLLDQKLHLHLLILSFQTRLYLLSVDVFRVIIVMQPLVCLHYEVCSTFGTSYKKDSKPHRKGFCNLSIAKYFIISNHGNLSFIVSLVFYRRKNTDSV